MEALTEKELAIRNVILKRADIITNNILPNVKEPELANYYVGKIGGLLEVFDLIGESLESIKIEL